jgi:hypothetical protein
VLVLGLSSDCINLLDTLDEEIAGQQMPTGDRPNPFGPICSEGLKKIGGSFKGKADR